MDLGDLQVIGNLAIVVAFVAQYDNLGDCDTKLLG